MRESIGKSIARKIFFNQCLPGWLSEKAIGAGNFLLLLGEEPRELQYTDAYRVPRRNIFSVERVEEIYLRQLSQRLDGVRLHKGELNKYLQGLIWGNQDFLVFNLDVEGSYFSQLDQAMTPVILFSWRSPETVVATYSSVGRDTEMLWEGVKSFAIFLWLSQDITLGTFASLSKRYEKAGFSEPSNMALRDFFWLRSVMEHTLVASAMVGTAAQEIVEQWFTKTDSLWNGVVRYKRFPLRVRGLVQMIKLLTANDRSPYNQILHLPSCLGSSLNMLMHIVYNAEKPWSQLCYFSKFKVLERVISCRTWIEETLQKFLSAPLTYIDRQGERQDIALREKSCRKSMETILWQDRDLYLSFMPRRLPTYPVSELLAAMSLDALCGKGIASFLNERNYKRKEEIVGTKQIRFTEKGMLTSEGKKMIQKFARENRDVTTDDLLKLLPSSVSRQVPANVIRAHIAVGRRKQ